VLEHNPGGRYLGIDQSQGNSLLCRHRYGTHDNIDFAVADAAAPPSDDASVDIALSVEAIHQFTNAQRFCKEMARVLRPGGRLLIAGIWSAIESPDKVLAQCGFELEAYRDITANVVASLEQTAKERRALVSNSQCIPAHRIPALMSWAGGHGYSVHSELSTGSLTYRCYRLIRF
jgi:ubiquinone/menaquinone biosynthesis C-methylase UbiE